MQLLRPPRAGGSPSADAQPFCEWQLFCEWQAWPVRPTTVCRLADRLRVRGGLLRLGGTGTTR